MLKDEMTKKIGLVLPISTINCFVNLKFTTNRMSLITIQSVIWSLGGHSTLVCQYIGIVAEQLAF